MLQAGLRGSPIRHLVVCLPMQDIRNLSRSSSKFGGRKAVLGGAEATGPVGSFRVAYVSHTRELLVMLHNTSNQMLELVSLIRLDLIDANFPEVSGFSAQGVVSS